MSLPPDCPLDLHKSTAIVEFAATLCRLLGRFGRRFRKVARYRSDDSNNPPPTPVDPWAICQGNFPSASAEFQSPASAPLAVESTLQPNHSPAEPASAASARSIAGPCSARSGKPTV